MKIKFDFVRTYIRSYDSGISAQNLNVYYSICPSNSLYNDIYVYHGQAKILKENLILAKAVYNQNPYNCCITFKDKITAAEYAKLKSDKTKRIKLPNENQLFYLHVCDAVPIMIGSVLDRFLAKNYQPNFEYGIECHELQSLMQGKNIHNNNDNSSDCDL